MKVSKEEANKDLMKRMKKVAREEWGFQPTKVVQSKKKYNRKKLGKVFDGEE